MSGLLADVFSFGDTLKRKARGLLADPIGTINQYVNNENDRAGRFNQLTAEAAQEGAQAIKSGQSMVGPKSQQLAGLLADAYNPTGMFIGASAKTWDKVAAEKAQNMLKAGVDPRQVWRETGTFKGADGALRQEIDDSLSSIRSNTLPTREINGQRYPDFKLADAIDHKPLFDAYPDTRGIEQSFMRGKFANGEYRDASDWIALSDIFQKKVPTSLEQQRIDAAKTAIAKFSNQPRVKRVDALMDGIVEKEGFDSARLERVSEKYAQPIENQRSALGREYTSALDAANSNPYSDFVLSPTAKSTQLHEIQHAIQQREGWAKGGSPQEMGNELGKLKDLDGKFNTAFEQYLTTTDDIARGNAQQEMMHWKQRIEPLRRIRGLDPEEAYFRLAGEAEARATQARMNMNPAQRREVYPFDSYDVPVDQLIVRGLLSN